MQRFLWMRGFLLSGLLVCRMAEAQATPVMAQDFEKTFGRATAAKPDANKPATSPRVWVVNIPNENASVQPSTEHPAQGKQSLHLHYHFTGEGQYLGVEVPFKILAPLHKVRWMMYGDGSGSGYGLYLTDSGHETHKFRDAATRKIDWQGWREIVFDLDGPHEIWGGDKNSKIDYPLIGITFEIGNDSKLPLESDLYFDALSVDSEKNALETLGGEVAVVSPAYGAQVRGDTPIEVAAPGFKKVTASSWKPGGVFGSDATVATIALDARGGGSVVFPANAFPHGPITVTLTGESGDYQDRCYLQLYNLGGISWNQGLPKDPPPAAGMKLVFADDFDRAPAISGSDAKATYYSHKPPNGSQDFSTLPFSNFESDRNPFLQIDSYLRIRADEKKNSAGLLSSLKNDGSGITASLPCYFECRFIGPNAIGTWPAFWLLSNSTAELKNGKTDREVPVDELDIIEAYGGEGPREPNAFDTYMVTPHAWNQGEAGKAAETKAFQAMHNPISMKKHGIPSTWYQALHTYGCKITATDTIYYCDNIEVGRHATLEASKKYPFYFLINLATGGGWPVDLSRYDGRADMYIDYVRVYGGK